MPVTAASAAIAVLAGCGGVAPSRPNGPPGPPTAAVRSTSPAAATSSSTLPPFSAAGRSVPVVTGSRSAAAGLVVAGLGGADDLAIAGAHGAVHEREPPADALDLRPAELGIVVPLVACLLALSAWPAAISQHSFAGDRAQQQVREAFR
jgi:hypothetical protein